MAENKNENQQSQQIMANPYETPPYKNDSLAGVVKNQVARTKYDWNQAGQEFKEGVNQIGQSINKGLTDIGYTTLVVGNEIKKAKDWLAAPATEAEKPESDTDRLYRYVGQGYQPREDGYLYSPDGVRSNVRFDGSIGGQTANTQAHSAATQQGVNVANIRLAPLGGGQLEKISTGENQVQPTSGVGGNTGVVGGFNGGAATQNQRQLKNADINFSQYGDDSSAPNQATAGGQNEKYTGEFTKNSNLGYDPNIRIADLDPSYLYGMDAQWANTDNAGYIARRNDMIASALYNEAIAQGRNPTKEDVINFLSSQKNWNNSTEADRFNTIESVWKRLGGIAGENQINNATGPDMSNVAPTYSDEALNSMENDLNKSTSGMLYGKVTADQDTAIRTLEDDNSVYKAMNEARINAYKQLRGMDSQAIAAAIISGSIASDSQQMRDLMQYDSSKYEYVMEALKQIRGQQNINNITNGTTDFSTNIGNSSKSEIEEFASSNANSSTSASAILNSVNSTLESNEAAKTAQETMDTIEKDMAKLKNRLKNLTKEANSVFKGDVPQYIVNAYVANRTSEIQNEMSMLEDRYNAAYSRYQSEWERVKWEKEFDLKKEELAIKKSNATRDQYMDEQGLALKYAEATGDTSSLNRNLMRTERNNNPTAMTTDVAKSLGLVEGIDYTIGDPFQSGSGTLYTARLLGDPIETTIKALDTAASTGRGAFYTRGGKQRWTHTAMSDAEWMGLSNDEKKNVVLSMLQREGGNINNMAAYGGGTTGTAGDAGDASLNHLERHGNVYDTSLYPGWNNLTDDEKITVWNLLTYQTNPSDLPKTGANGESNKKIRAAAGAIGRDFGYDERKFKQVDAVQKAWDKSFGPNGVGSANTTAASLLKTLSNSFKEFNATDLQTVNSWINQFKLETGDPTVGAMYSDLRVAASEYAKALKGSASATTEEIREIHNLLSGKMSNEQAQEVFKHFAQNLVEKNATEAQNYARVVGYKPDSPYLRDVSEWFSDELGINLGDYYNYNSNGGWSVFSQSNNPSNDDMIYNIFSY